MESQNKQLLIVQELNKMVSNINSADFHIVCYTLDGRYKIAISSLYGMFPGTYIAEIVKLSKKYNFKFYISNTCTADIEGVFFLIIY